MSEPLSSGEIEDVLSSIRRLVSDDLRPAPRPAPVAAKPVQDANKLILTPSLRVVTDGIAGRNDAATPGDMAAPEAESVLPEADVRQGGIAQPESGAGPAEPLPADWADTQGGNPEPESLTAQDLLAQDLLAQDLTAQDLTDAIADAGNEGGGIADTGASLTQLVSSIGSAVDEQVGEWEPETGVVDFPGTGWRSPDWVQEAVLLDENAADHADSGGVESAASDPTPDVLTLTELAPGAATLAGQATVAPAPSDLATNDAAEAEALAEILAAEPRSDTNTETDRNAGPNGNTAAADLFAEDEGYFDEAVLRDLVRDLIREELSGALGERITRNVRKLVRAEINRALTARDFD